MPENIEIETKELQDEIADLQEEREERREEAARSQRWMGLIGLSTAMLAVFAAVGALQSGNLVNEALLHQLKASDTWAEYQASREKEHFYTLSLNAIVDANAGSSAVRAAAAKPAATPAAHGGESATPAPALLPVFAAKAASARTAEYLAKVYAEIAKETGLSKEARELEAESARELNAHHFFEYAVALIQVAIALGAISALTRVRYVWYISLLGGGIGIALIAYGFTQV